MAFTIDLTYDMVDNIIVQELSASMQILKDDLEKGNAKVFSIDPEEDAKEIQRYIDAFELVLSWYTVQPNE